MFVAANFVRNIFRAGKYVASYPLRADRMHLTPHVKGLFEGKLNTSHTFWYNPSNIGFCYMRTDRRTGVAKKKKGILLLRTRYSTLTPAERKEAR